MTVIGKTTVIHIGLLTLWGIALVAASPVGPWWWNAGLLVAVVSITLFVQRKTSRMRRINFR